MSSMALLEQAEQPPGISASRKGMHVFHLKQLTDRFLSLALKQQDGCTT